MANILKKLIDTADISPIFFMHYDSLNQDIEMVFAATGTYNRIGRYLNHAPNTF